MALLLAGCNSDEGAPETSTGGGTHPQLLANFADLRFSSPPIIHHDGGGRVQIEISSAWSDDGRLVLRAIFTPDDPGFHLYGSQLAMTGVEGIGRPTLIEVSGDDKRFAEIGPLVADKSPLTHFDETLNISLPVYPNGPVELYLPIRFQTVPEGRMQIPVQVTYMSCSDKRCNSPIERVVQEITIPAPGMAP